MAMSEKTDNKSLPYTEANLQKVAKVIKDGGIAVFPTDTVYDIGCSVKKPEALKRIFKIKDRPLSQSFPSSFPGLKSLWKLPTSRIKI